MQRPLGLSTHAKKSEQLVDEIVGREERFAIILGELLGGLMIWIGRNRESEPSAGVDQNHGSTGFAVQDAIMIAICGAIVGRRLR